MTLLAAEKQFREQVRVLLMCRHPNVHYMVGVSRFADAPRLVMEQAWGSVSAALISGPLGHAAALSIATQIASAVRYLHLRGILHRAIGIDNVMLLAPPVSGLAIAKLGNFASASRDTHDRGLLAVDVRALIVFVYNVFKEKLEDCLPFPATRYEMRTTAGLPKALFQFPAELVHELPEITLLVTQGWNNHSIEAKTVAETLADLSLKFSPAQPSSLSLVAQPQRQPAAQPERQPDSQPAAQVLGLPRDSGAQQFSL
jgi:serine/threonine protein kinase